MKMVAQFLILLSVNVIISCSSTETPKLDDSNKCNEPRPEFCTMDFNPVCATRDNGIRCVTTPCSSTESATYSNGCSACADKNVFSYVAGECEK